MRRFVQLYEALDASTSTNDKVAALVAYFTAAPPEDAAWAAWIFTGGRVKRAITSTQLREALIRATGLPAWLVEDSYEHVGDLSETIALLLESRGLAHEHTPTVAQGNEPSAMSLKEVFEGIILPMQRMDAEQRVHALGRAWGMLGAHERFVFHKLISGSFRVGVSRTLVVRAIAEAFGLPRAMVAHRVMGSWKPSAQAFAQIVAPATTSADGGNAPSQDGLNQDGSQPYPFCLASPLEVSAASLDAALGPVTNWLAEWKWDGIRAQVLRRGESIAIWSRGEELLTDRFGELASELHALPPGIVLDGEVLAWDAQRDKPAPFADLQTRITRTRGPKPEELLFVDVPVRFIAYDLLEHEGRDVRARPLRARRELLEGVLHELHMRSGSASIGTSTVLHTGSWAELATLRGQARERGVEGLMLKRADSAYGTGRERGVWWKWKVDPYTIDAVLVAAQGGHGRRASVLTDYTFAVWSGQQPGTGELVTIAKAYSGLTDDEIDRVDAWIRRHTLAKHGPVRSVTPELVFEIAFEAIAESNRHKAGLALRFPRIVRMRSEKRPHEADSVGQVRALLGASFGASLGASPGITPS